jgi:hypothetical protein
VQSLASSALVLRTPPSSTTVWPGEFVEIELPGYAPADTEYALEPRIDAPSVKRLTASQLWPCPNIVSSVAGRIRIPNLSSDPRSLKLGVFKRPEDVNVSVEYLNPSSLVKKSSGGFRLVIAFADVGRYSKPQPSLMSNVDSTLRHIAQWKHLIATDLTS